MNLHNNNERLQILIKIRSQKRAEWRAVRMDRLKIKNDLAQKGFNVTEIRKSKEYKLLKKKQKFLSKEIRHLEKKVNKILSARESG